MKQLKDRKVSFLRSHARLLMILQPECFPIVQGPGCFARSPHSKSSRWSRVGLLGGLFPSYPLRCQILEEVSDETLSAWRRELPPTLEIWVAQSLQSHEVSVIQWRRPTLSHCCCCIISLCWCDKQQSLLLTLWPDAWTAELELVADQLSPPRDVVPVHLEQIAATKLTVSCVHARRLWNLICFLTQQLFPPCAGLGPSGTGSIYWKWLRSRPVFVCQSAGEGLRMYDVMPLLVMNQTIFMNGLYFCFVLTWLCPLWARGPCALDNRAELSLSALCAVVKSWCSQFQAPERTTSLEHLVGRQHWFKGLVIGSEAILSFCFNLKWSC